jgi:hypothetical protein
MSSMTVDEMTTSPETGPEQLPAGPSLVPPDSPAPAPRDRLRPLEVAQCSMCGVTRPLGLLVPDGAQACADVRWYCKDVKSCTERWTAALPPRRTYLPAVSGTAIEGTGEPAPDAAPAELPDGMLEEALSAG